MTQKHGKSKTRGLTFLFRQFFKLSQSSGVLLIICTVFSLLLANSSLGNEYSSFWQIHLDASFLNFEMNHTVVEWINDGLMTVFFLLVGLEIERELYIGELSSRKKAMLPVIGAIGGMLIPALFYLIFNFNHPESIRGIGIPTATDIAFAIAVLGMLGNRIPASLKVFLTALAIIDDLGAILVIAIFYGHGFSLTYFVLAAVLFGILLLLNKLKVTSLWIYLPLGVLLWFLMMHSGIHATLSGVLLAFAIPFENGKPDTSSYKLEKAIHWPVSMLIVPLFALANTAISIDTSLTSRLLSAESLGIFFGLVLGKPIGIFLASVAGSKMGWTYLPQNISLKMLWGAGMLGGIGFTMSIFVTNLAFSNPSFIELGKISVLIASVTAAVSGYFFLSKVSKK